MIEELFGSVGDIRQKSIDDLEKLKIFEAEKYAITRIELKKPFCSPGTCISRPRTIAPFRIHIDHKKTYGHIEQLMKSFLPEKLQID